VWLGKSLVRVSCQSNLLSSRPSRGLS
jgi:hypothetical protein